MGLACPSILETSFDFNIVTENKCVIYANTLAMNEEYGFICDLSGPWRWGEFGGQGWSYKEKSGKSRDPGVSSECPHPLVSFVSSFHPFWTFTGFTFRQFALWKMKTLRARHLKTKELLVHYVISLKSSCHLQREDNNSYLRIPVVPSWGCSRDKKKSMCKALAGTQ